LRAHAPVSAASATSASSRDDERVAPAQLEDGLLELVAGRRRDRATRRTATGDGRGFDPFVLDDVVDQIGRNQ